MLDGLEAEGPLLRRRAGHCDRQRQRPAGPVGRFDGDKRVCFELLSDLADRRLDCNQGVLIVLDGGEPLRAAVDAAFRNMPVQRCIRHKERNVLDHLPDATGPPSSACCARLGGSPITGGDARTGRGRHAAALGRPSAALEDVELDEPGRVDDRRLPHHQPQRQAPAERRMCLRWTAAGMVEPSASSARSSAPSTSAALTLAVERNVVAQRSRPSRALGSQPLTDHPDHHHEVPHGRTSRRTSLASDRSCVRSRRC